MPNSLAFLACYFVLSKRKPLLSFLPHGLKHITHTVYVNSLLGTLNARSKMPSAAPLSPAVAKNLSAVSSSAYTSSGSGGSTQVLTTAIVLGTADAGTTTLAAEEGLRAFEAEREKSRQSTPRSGYARLEDTETPPVPAP